MLDLGRFGFALGQFEHHTRIVQALFGFDERLEFLAQRIALVDEALGLFAVGQKFSWAIRDPSSARRSCMLGTSKKPPQMREFVGVDC